MDLNSIVTVAHQELVINLRNRWVVVFAFLFWILVLAISYFGLVTAGAIGFQGFARTSASLLNLVTYIIPLVALIMGTLSFSGEKSSSELLFSQPVSRSDILLGKIAGLFASILGATLMAFGFAGLIIAAKAGSMGASRYPIFIALSLLLALIFLSLSALVSVICRRRPAAFAVSLLVWFFLVVLYDLLVIGVTFLLGEREANILLFASLAGNPVDMVRVASLIALDGKDIFGAAGAMLLRFVGGDGPALAFLLVGLSLWFFVPLLVAQALLKKQDL